MSLLNMLFDLFGFLSKLFVRLSQLLCLRFDIICMSVPCLSELREVIALCIATDTLPQSASKSTTLSKNQNLHSLSVEH